jgi:hypothetical protein
MACDTGEELRNVVSERDRWEISEEELAAAHEAHEVAKQSMAGAKPKL